MNIKLKMEEQPNATSSETYNTDVTNKLTEIFDENIEIECSSFESRIISYKIKATEYYITPEDFMKDLQIKIIKMLDMILSQHKNIKLSFELCSYYVNPSNEVEERTLSSDIYLITSDHSKTLEEIYECLLKEIIVAADEFQGNGSGWTIVNVSHLMVNLDEYSPPTKVLKWNEIGRFVYLPKWIHNEGVCINVMLEDEASFAWAVLSALYPTEDLLTFTNNYKHYKDEFILDDIKFPIDKPGIKRFELLNNISINIYEALHNTISSPVYYTQRKREKHVNLLVVKKGNIEHFCWIKDLNRLIVSTGNKEGNTLRNGENWFCDGCFLHFSQENKLLGHREKNCSRIKTILPNENQILKFTDTDFTSQVPLVVYANFKTMLKKLPKQNQKNKYCSVKKYKHEPFSFGFYIKSADDSLSKYVQYTGSSCVEHFIGSLEQELSDYIDFYKRPSFIPVVFHELSKYHAHFIIRQLKNYKVNIIAITKENYISFSVYSTKLYLNLRFLDSFRFLASNLNELASNLNKPEQFCTVRKMYPNNNLESLTRTGIFPTEYIDCIEKLNETSQNVPPKDCFYSNLDKCGIKDEDYIHVQMIWTEFQIKSLGEYSDLCLKIDVLLLVDVFENFRNTCLKAYDLDPAHFYTTPGLSWKAMLKYTKVELELFTDFTMVNFIMRGIRGGINQCCKKYARANNKYLQKYDPKQESNYIVYYDANNLYGWAMSQKLPLKDFRWLTENEIANFEISKCPNDGTKGFVLEVDLEYPTSLHESHNDLPLCPEHIVREIGKSRYKNKQLITSLYDKNNYILHYINLKLYLDLGLKLKKIHNIVEFTQSSWLQPYIDLNTKMRTDALNKFEKIFYKLMNNAVYGKTFENVDKRVDVRLVTTWEDEQNGHLPGARTLISKPNFCSSQAINENLAVIQMNRQSIKYDKPIYIGFTVLELSKTLMYDFHYRYILPKFGKRVDLLYTDTDSFIYDLRTDDFYADIRNDVLERFDTSEYPENNRFLLKIANGKVVGMFKDECKGVMIEEFIGIRSKCYFILKENKEIISKMSGGKMPVRSASDLREDYIKCLNELKNVYNNWNSIVSEKHTVFTQTHNRIVLRNVDDKRFVIPNDVAHRTLAWGHKDIKKYQSTFKDMD